MQEGGSWGVTARTDFLLTPKEQKGQAIGNTRWQELDAPFRFVQTGSGILLWR
jgi:hypothetical protein